MLTTNNLFVKLISIGYFLGVAAMLCLVLYMLGLILKGGIEDKQSEEDAEDTTTNI